MWCRLSVGNLLQAGVSVYPLRAAACAQLVVLVILAENAPVDDGAGSAAGSESSALSSALHWQAALPAPASRTMDSENQAGES